MAETDRQQLARAMYDAYAQGDREAIEEIIGEDFRFSAPPDPSLDREGYFERCWPNAGHLNDFEIVRSIESGDEVVITYEATREDGTRFRNTEVLTFVDGKQTRAEVYFGWDLD